MPTVLRTRRFAAILSLLLAGITSCTELSGPTEQDLSTPEEAQVVAVIDGDTIKVQNSAGQSRVRIIGIDTPEINRDGGKDECYSQSARDELNNLVYGKTVELHADATQSDVDRYGRLLRHIYVEGTNAALTLLETGAAREYTFDAPYVGQAEYRDAEHDAKQDRLGLWGTCAE